MFVIGATVSGERAGGRTGAGRLWARLRRVLAYVVSGPDVDFEQYSREGPSFGIAAWRSVPAAR